MHKLELTLINSNNDQVMCYEVLFNVKKSKSRETFYSTLVQGFSFVSNACKVEQPALLSLVECQINV